MVTARPSRSSRRRALGGAGAPIARRENIGERRAIEIDLPAKRRSERCAKDPASSAVTRSQRSSRRPSPWSAARSSIRSSGPGTATTTTPAGANTRVISATGRRDVSDSSASKERSAYGRKRSALATTQVASGVRRAASSNAAADRSTPCGSNAKAARSAARTEPSPQPMSSTAAPDRATTSAKISRNATRSGASWPAANSRRRARAAARLSPGLRERRSCGCSRFQ